MRKLTAEGRACRFDLAKSTSLSVGASLRFGDGASSTASPDSPLAPVLMLWLTIPSGTACGKLSASCSKDLLVDTREPRRARTLRQQTRDEVGGAHLSVRAQRSAHVRRELRTERLIPTRRRHHHRRAALHLRLGRRLQRRYEPRRPAQRRRAVLLLALGRTHRARHARGHRHHDAACRAGADSLQIEKLRRRALARDHAQTAANPLAHGGVKVFLGNVSKHHHAVALEPPLAVCLLQLTQHWHRLAAVVQNNGVAALKQPAVGRAHPAERGGDAIAHDAQQHREDKNADQVECHCHRARRGVLLGHYVCARHVVK
eukprot:4531532-Pleurochrysis_carterae.AAC.1